MQRFEEPRGDIVVGGRVTTTRRRAKPAVLLQEHAHLLDLQELGDSLDCGLQGVGQREPRDRLGHHLEQRASAFELELEVARALGRAQGVCGAGRERRQGRQVGLGRRDILREEELQRGERRLPERQRRDLRRPRVVGDAGRTSLLDRLADDRRGPAEARLDGAERGDQLGPLRARRQRAPPRAPVVSTAIRTACCAARRGSPPAARASPASSSRWARTREPGDLRSERPHGERELSGGKPRERTIVVTEVVADPDQLHRADNVAAGARGHGEQPGRPSLLRSPAALARSRRRRRPLRRARVSRPPRRRATSRRARRLVSRGVPRRPRTRRTARSACVASATAAATASSATLRSSVSATWAAASARRSTGSRWASTTIPGRSIAYNPGMPVPARKATAVLDEDPPSLDPRAIEHNYRRERARRRARTAAAKRRQAVERQVLGQPPRAGVRGGLRARRGLARDSDAVRRLGRPPQRRSFAGSSNFRPE